MMAGLVGLLMGGWGWFAPASVAYVAASIQPGGIRRRPGPRHPRRRRWVRRPRRGGSRCVEDLGQPGPG